MPKNGRPGTLAARTANELTLDATAEVSRAARRLAIVRCNESLTVLNDRLDHATICQIIDTAVESLLHREPEP